MKAPSREPQPRTKASERVASAKGWRRLWVAGVWIALSAPLTADSPQQSPAAIGEIRTYMVQLQKTEDASSVELLAKSTYELLIVEPVGTYRGASLPKMKAMVTRLRGARPGRSIVAYLDIAEADSHRSYWESNWKAPTKKEKGSPDFLVGPDPDGWKDTYLVRYWDPRWQALLMADLDKLLSAGFDGFCLDWAGAYLDPTIAPLAKAAQIDAARAVVDLVARLRQAILQANPKATVILQNAPGLIDADPRVADLVDAVLFEGTWYSGKAEVAWSDPEGGDRENRATEAGRSPEALLAQAAKWRARGKPVFTLDYCLNADHAGEVYRRSKKLGAVPLVSRTALDRPTETPPPWLP